MLLGTYFTGCSCACVWNVGTVDPLGLNLIFVRVIFDSLHLRLYFYVPMLFDREADLGPEPEPDFLELERRLGAWGRMHDRNVTYMMDNI